MPYIMSYSHRPGIPGITEDGYWKEEWGGLKEKQRLKSHPWMYGLPTDAKYFPSSGYLHNKPKNIPNIFCQAWWFCDAEIKDIIEDLEPGRHCFYPYSLRSSKEGPVVKELFIIHPQDPITSIDVEKSPKALPQKYNDKYEIKAGGMGDKPNIKRGHYAVLTEDYPKDRHIWRDTRVETQNGIFISDHLHDVIKQYHNIAVVFWKLKPAEKFK